MALTASAGSGGESSFESVPPGSYEAVCYRLVDAGTAEEDYKGEISKKHKIYIFWEIPELTLSDGRPYSIFHGYTLSLNERSNLRRDLQAWRNKPFTEDELQAFDLTKLLGVTCKINVVLNSNGNAKIDGIFSSDGGAKRVEPTNPTSVFDLEEYCKEFTGESCEAKLSVMSMTNCHASFSGVLVDAMSPTRTRLAHALKWLQLKRRATQRRHRQQLHRK